MKHRPFVILPLLIFLLASCARLKEPFFDGTTMSASPGTFFVATNGNDHWSGTISTPSRNKDGPFLTVARALQAARDVKARENKKTRVHIYVRGGTYWLKEPLVLTPDLSRLEIAAYPGETPVISGGERIENWKPTKINGKTLWVAPVKSDQVFHQLWVNGERRQRARHPNTGYLQIASLVDQTPTWENGHSRWRFAEGDVKSWPSATNGDAIVMTRWVESRMPIESINQAERLINSKKKSVFQLQSGDYYYVEGIFEALDQPGEWYFDHGQELLYYLPKPNETLRHFEAIVPRLQDCLQMNGQPEQEKFVEYVSFRGLTFSHNEWYFPSNYGEAERHISTTPDPEIYGFAQAAFGVPGMARAEGARGCTFYHCKFIHSGSYGLQLGKGCQDNRVSACEFSDLAAGGIRIGETLLRTNVSEQSFGNRIVDCEIADGGKMFHSAEGIWIGQSYGNRIQHNSIHDFYYTGISIGWTWGYEDSLTSNNLVEFNHIHHLGQRSNGDGPILSDMGGIYTLGREPGTVIRNNLFHDIYGLRYGGWGIYFDEGSSFIRAENNVVFGTTHGGFHQHYGEKNIVKNNIFAFARDFQLQRTRPEDHVSFTFENNIVYFDRGVLLAGNWSEGKIRIDNNVYFDTRANQPGINFPKGLEAWHQLGYDLHSVMADPLFTSTNLANFSLRRDSPSLKIGFRNFDLHSVGPRANSSW